MIPSPLVENITEVDDLVEFITISGYLLHLRFITFLVPRILILCIRDREIFRSTINIVVVLSSVCQFTFIIKLLVMSHPEIPSLLSALLTDVERVYLYEKMIYYKVDSDMI